MKYEVRMTRTFRKDTERCRKRGLDMELLKTAVRLLEANGKLLAEYLPHKLTGNYAGCWECHLKPDWLLIWEHSLITFSFCFEKLGPLDTQMQAVNCFNDYK